MCPANGNRLAPYYMGPTHTGELWVYIGTPLPNLYSNLNPSGNTGVMLCMYIHIYSSLYIFIIYIHYYIHLYIFIDLSSDFIHAQVSKNISQRILISIFLPKKKRLVKSQILIIKTKRQYKQRHSPPYPARLNEKCDDKNLFDEALRWR